jgi:hypothetical protein
MNGGLNGFDPMTSAGEGYYTTELLANMVQPFVPRGLANVFYRHLQQTFQLLRMCSTTHCRDDAGSLKNEPQTHIQFHFIDAKRERKIQEVRLSS